MGTHSLFLVKVGDKLWGFHHFHDGWAWYFYEKVKDIKYPYPYFSMGMTIFLKALEFYAGDEYEDGSDLNLFKRD